MDKQFECTGLECTVSFVHQIICLLNASTVLFVFFFNFWLDKWAIVLHLSVLGSLYSMDQNKQIYYFLFYFMANGFSQIIFQEQSNSTFYFFHKDMKWKFILHIYIAHSNIAWYTYAMNCVHKILILSMMCAYVWWLRALIDCTPKFGNSIHYNCGDMDAWKSLMASRMFVGIPSSLILYISVSSCIVVVWHTARGGNGTIFFLNFQDENWFWMHIEYFQTFSGQHFWSEKMCPSACLNLGLPGRHARTNAFCPSKIFLNQKPCKWSIQNTPRTHFFPGIRQKTFVRLPPLHTVHFYPNNSSLHLYMIKKYNICWLWFAYLFLFILQQSIYLKNCGNRNAKSNQLDCKHFFHPLLKRW